MTWEHDGGSHAIDPAPGRYIFPPASACGWRSTFRIQLEADWIAPARDAVPQTVHGFRRRQIGNLEIDRRRAAERPGFRARSTSDMDEVAEILKKDFSTIYKPGEPDDRDAAGPS